MKKQLMLLILLISMGSLCAQTFKSEKTRPNYYQQGEWMLSVSPNFGWARQAEVGNSGLTLGGLLIDSRVTAGKFVKDKLFLGGSIAYKGSPFADINNTSLKTGLVARTYLTRRALSPFIEGNAGYYRETLYDDSFILRFPQQGMYLGARIGLEYRLGKLGLEGSWGRELRMGDNDFARTFNRSPFQFGVNFHF
jgi:hypothetical protein